jgi:putative ABC transport system permease protein
MLSLTWRMLVRDWRAGELTALGLALVLAVAALTSVGLLADRVRQGLALQSHQVLGGDLLLSADHPWNDEMRTEAGRLGLQLAESVSFPSMVLGGEGAYLAEIKAVSDNYPLRGALRISAALDVPDIQANRTPAPGEAWPDERLAYSLSGANPRLGSLGLRVAAILALDPDRGINAFALAPRLLINLADLPATGLVQPGSRIAWRLHLAGESSAVQTYREWAERRLGRGERLESLDNARPEIRNLIERAGRFLRLASLLTVILSAVAIALAADRFLRRHLDACAVMRCLGAYSRQILLIHGGEFVLFGLAATVAGCLLGFAIQWVLQALLAGLLVDDLPWPSWHPWVQGVSVGVVLLVGFVLPPLLRLRQVPTLRVLRREWARAESGLVAAYGLGAVLLAGLMIWVAGEVRLGLIVIAGFAVAFLVYGIAARLMVIALRLGSRRKTQRGFSAWRLGVANLHRRWQTTVALAIALGLGMTALLLFTLVRDDMLISWRNRVPADAPNRFVINIQPDQRPALREFFSARGLPSPVLEPMVRGRIVEINGRPVAPDDYLDERARRLVEREFNLSWTENLPFGNAVSAGRWHGASRSAELSVEEGLAETLGLRLGDQLSYAVAGLRITATVSSLRRLDWDSMRVNFFVIASPGVLEQFPVSYITSFYLPSGHGGMVGELVRAFPNLTVIDVTTLLRQLQGSLDQVSQVVQTLFGLALAAGLVVLFVALQATGDERRRDLAVLRALGARTGQLRAALLVEFAILGALAGLLAGLGTAVIGWALGRFVFHLQYVPSVSLPVTGLVLGMVGMMVAGFWATLSTRRAEIGETLRA